MGPIEENRGDKMGLMTRQSKGSVPVTNASTRGVQVVRSGKSHSDGRRSFHEISLRLFDRFIHGENFSELRYLDERANFTDRIDDHDAAAVFAHLPLGKEERSESRAVAKLDLAQIDNEHGNFFLAKDEEFRFYIRRVRRIEVFILQMKKLNVVIFRYIKIHCSVLMSES